MRVLVQCLALGLLFLCPFAAADDPAPLALGAQMADFGLRRINTESGQLTDMHWLSDYVGKSPHTPKRALVLSFYATWCKGCLDEMPALQRLQDTYGDLGLQVLGVNVRALSEDAITALSESVRVLREKGVRYPVLFDRYTHRNQLLYLGDLARLPCNFVVDAKGKIVARIQGGDQNLALLEAAIKKELDLSGPRGVAKP